MFVDRIEARPSRNGLVAIRMLRRWVAIRAAGRAAIPDLVAFGEARGISAPVAIALASLFQLTEAALERPLAAECCCSEALGADERAVLMLLAGAPAPPSPAAPAAIPHGLSGALAWAVASVRELLSLEDRDSDLAVTRCPFRTPG